MPFCYLVTQKDEITKKKKRHAKKRNNARRKDEKTKSATRKDEKNAMRITPFKTRNFRLFAWRLFVISLIRLALFLFSRDFFFCYFVFSTCHNARRNDGKNALTKWYKPATIDIL